MLLSLSCLAPAPLAGRPFTARGSGRRAQRGVHAAAKAKKQQPAAPTEPTLLPPQPVPEEERDFFEGEGWEIFGNVLSWAVPVLLVAGVLVGGFAAGTYNEGATVFIESAKSPDDTAKFFTVTD